MWGSFCTVLKWTNIYFLYVDQFPLFICRTVYTIYLWTNFKSFCGPVFNIYMWNSLHSLCVDLFIMFICGPIKIILWNNLHYIYRKFTMIIGWLIYTVYKWKELDCIHVDPVNTVNMWTDIHILYVFLFTIFVYEPV